MNQMMQIQNQEIQVKEFNGQRVVTFKDIDLVHERPSGTAKAAFLRNKNRFVSCNDYFPITRKEFGTLYVPNEKLQGNPNLTMLLITESGYLMLAKVFDDDLAWAVQRQLVNCYFKVKELEQVEISEITDLSRRERIKIAELLATSSQYNLKAVIDMVKEYMSPDVVAAYMDSNQVSSKPVTTVKMSVSPDFSKKLVEWMTSNGLNQEQLRKVLGLPKSTVSTYCHGGATPRAERMKDIAERLKVSIDYFLE